MPEQKTAFRFIFLLENIEEPELEPGEEQPWAQGEQLVDHLFSMVVIADNAEQARDLAASACMDEGRRAWLNSRYSTCETIGTTDMTPRVMVVGHSPNNPGA